MAHEPLWRRNNGSGSGRGEKSKKAKVKRQKYCGGGRRRTFRIAGIVPAHCKCRGPRVRWDLCPMGLWDLCAMLGGIAVGDFIDFD